MNIVAIRVKMKRSKSFKCFSIIFKSNVSNRLPRETIFTSLSSLLRSPRRRKDSSQIVGFLVLEERLQSILQLVVHSRETFPRDSLSSLSTESSRDVVAQRSFDPQRHNDQSNEDIVDRSPSPECDDARGNEDFVSAEYFLQISRTINFHR